MALKAVLVALALLVAMPAGARAADPAPGTPAWTLREAANFAAAHQRTLDYAAQGASDTAADPRRAPAAWAAAGRGVALDVRFPNRYGAELAGTLFRPAGDVARPLPTVVLEPGAEGRRSMLLWLAEALAEHGYLAFVVDPQGAGDSATEPDPAFCAAGPWQQPQELGITERGRCAGVQPEGPPTAADELAVVATVPLGTTPDFTATARIYERYTPRYAFALLDAATWLTSDANPWRAWVDPRRLGVAGHSVGAYAAALVGNGDGRFRAAVALDPFHPLDHGVQPRVPTLWVQSEQELLAPRVRPPEDPEALHPARASLARARALGVPAGMLVLRASTHGDFTDGAVPASRDGQTVAAWATLTWMDRFLRGDRAATARLFAPRLDDHADRSSIGTGGVDAAGANVPPAVTGRAVADVLSLYHPSVLAAFGAACDDLRLQGCALPAPRLGVPSARPVTRPGGRGRTRAVVARVRLAAGDVPPVQVRVLRGARVLGAARASVPLGVRGRAIRVRVPLRRGVRAGRARVVATAPGLRAGRRVTLR